MAIAEAEAAASAAKAAAAAAVAKAAKWLINQQAAKAQAEQHQGVQTVDERIIPHISGCISDTSGGSSESGSGSRTNLAVAWTIAALFSAAASR